MHDFTYIAPPGIEDAVKALAREGEKARPLCGGTDLIVQMRSGVRKPLCLVDVKRIRELRELVFDPAKGLIVGAAVPCADVAAHPAIKSHYPGLSEAANLIGSIQIRNRASLGGNLANGSPAADTVPALIALNARAIVCGANGRREVPVEGFVTSPGRTILNPGELISHFVIPLPRSNTADAYLRFVPRNEMDIAVAGVGVSVSVDNDRCVDARIVLGAVGPTQIVAQQAIDYLRGKRLDDAAISRAAELAAEAARPIDDVRGTREFRRHLVYVLTRRALLTAIERARSGRVN